MHVVHAVRSSGFAGVERYVCDVSGELIRRGWSVTVIGGDPRRMRAEMPPTGTHVPAASTAAVARALVEHRGDLVHAHMSAADAAAALLAFGPARPALVTTRHFAAPRGSAAPARSVLALMIRRYDVRLAISRFVAASDDRAAEIVLLNGVPNRERMPLRERSRTVAVVQRHEPEKQTDVALRAWAVSCLHRQGWRLALAGRGSQTPALVALMNALGIDSSVDVLGFVPDAASLMATSGALLATAPAEPFGLAVVEAMSTGTPVVASAAGGHLETVGRSSWTFPPGDVEACAQALDRLAGPLDDVEAHAVALWSRQREHLCLARHVDHLESYYRSALAGRGRVAL